MAGCSFSYLIISITKGVIAIKKMIMLVSVVDSLLELNYILKQLTGLGYQERFPKLDNVYEVIRMDSIFCGCEADEQIRTFYEIIEDNNKTPRERAEILLKPQNWKKH